MSSRKRKAACVEIESDERDERVAKKKSTKAVARAMFNRAVESRVARYMKQNDVLVLRMHQELCRAKTDFEDCVKDLERHKQVIAQQQAKIVRLQSELKDHSSQEPVDQSEVLSRIFDLPEIEADIDALFTDKAEIEPVPLLN